MALNGERGIWGQSKSTHIYARGGKLPDVAVLPTINSPCPEIPARVVLPAFNCNAPALITVLPV